MAQRGPLTHQVTLVAGAGSDLGAAVACSLACDATCSAGELLPISGGH